MSRQFDYRATPPHPAAAVFAAMVDADCLRARLAALGGRNAALLEHEADADSARFRVRHGLDPSDMPQAVRLIQSSVNAVSLSRSLRICSPTDPSIRLPSSGTFTVTSVLMRSSLPLPASRSPI